MVVESLNNIVKINPSANVSKRESRNQDQFASVGGKNFVEEDSVRNFNNSALHRNNYDLRTGHQYKSEIISNSINAS